MKICSAIIHEMNFEKNVISPCCNVYARKIPSIAYEGGDFDKNMYIEHIMYALKNLQIDETLCKGCDRLEDREELSLSEGIKTAFKQLSSHPIKFLSINHFRNFCNCKCVYCNLWKQKQASPYRILPTLQKLQSEKLLADNCRISWGGGEPSILNEFEETSLWIMQHKFHQKIHTNAIKQSQSIATILKKGLCSVDISIDAGTPETHKAVKGLDIWQQVLKNCQYYRKHALSPRQVSLKYIVFEKNNNRDDINSFLNVCRKLDCKNIEISLNFEEINANTVSETTLENISYLYHESIKNGFICTPFFIPDKYKSRILS